MALAQLNAKLRVAYGDVSLVRAETVSTFAIVTGVLQHGDPYRIHGRILVY
jgi:hypothetical protein